MSSSDLVMYICTVFWSFMLLKLRTEQARIQAEREHLRWWRDYAERERLLYLKLMWRARFEPLPNETEDASVARFRTDVIGLEA